MKNVIFYLLLITLTIFFACNEKNEKTIINPEAITPAQITKCPTKTIYVDMNFADSVVATFEWNDAQYSYDAAVQYTLLAKSDSGMTQLGSIYGNALSLTNSEINVEALNNLGGVTGEPLEVEVMLESSIGVEKYKTLSSGVMITIVPFTAEPAVVQ